MDSLTDQEKRTTRAYHASVLYVGLFYGLLVLWTVGTVPIIWQRFEQGVFREDWLYGLMIGFFYLYTWYWSLGIVSRISLDPEGRIELKSLRRAWIIKANEIRTIEGSRFSRGIGFIRLKVHRESIYIFRSPNPVLADIIQGIKEGNPLIKAIRI